MCEALCRVWNDPDKLAKLGKAFGGMTGGGLFPGMPQGDAEGGEEEVCRCQ